MGNRPFSRKNCNFFCKLTAFYPLRHGFAVPAPPRGRLCAMPGSLPSPLKPSPWGRWLRPAGADGRGAPAPQRPRPLSQALSGLPALPKGEPRARPEDSSLHLKLQQRALDLGSPFGGAGAGAPERARPLKIACVPAPALHSSPQNDTIAAANHRRRTFFRQMTERGLLL